MWESTPVSDQLAAVREDPLRVLVVGAGVAGLTLAGLLRRRGLHPVVLERSGPDAGAGYMLAMMPLVDPVLAALDLTEEYVRRGVPLARYRIRGRTGATLREYQMSRLLARFGDYRGISRGGMLGVLGSPGPAVSHRATVSALEQDADVVRAVIEDGSGAGVTGEFDLVVAADGLHSATRGLVLGDDRVSGFDSGWGGWVGWLRPDRDHDLGEELWGDGTFIGTYPVEDRLGFIVCGPRADTRVGPRRFAARARTAFASPGQRVRDALDVLDRAEPDECYFWSLVDRRAATWSVGRVALLGDAAAGFLPTAGIGAGMAMESAWVLDGHLGGHLGAAGRERVPAALREYEAHQRPRVEAAQENSRQLARLMFRGGRPFAFARDLAARFVPLGVALRPIQRLLVERPALAAGAPAGSSPGYRTG